MRLNNLMLVLLVFLLSCSSPSTTHIPRLRPYKIVVIGTPEVQEIAEITSQAQALLLAKDYKKLEEMARKYRLSKECFPDGSWKLQKFYDGVTLDEEALADQITARLASLLEWAAAAPQSITAQVALAQELTVYAWNARGKDKSVSDEAKKAFTERLQEAANILRRASALPDKCPQWYAEMQLVGIGLSMPREDFETLFASAIQYEPAFFSFYSRKVEYLQPRWNGKKGELQLYVQQTADTFGGEAGDIFYARIAWALKRSSENVFKDFNLTWERVDRGFQALQKQHANSIHLANARAYFAITGRPAYQNVRTAVDAMDGKVDTSLWTSAENFEKLTDRLYTR
jgi:hypothetical protein